MKKCLLILGGFLVFGLSTGVMAEEADWGFDPETGEIKEYYGSDTVVTVPSEIDGVTVTALGMNVFNNANDITELVLPDTITRLGNNAISFMDNVTSIQLPENLTIIEDGNFMGLAALETITIPGKVCYVGDFSFRSLYGLKSMTFEGCCPLIAAGISFDFWSDYEVVIQVPDDEVEEYETAFSSLEAYAEGDQTLNIQPSGKNAAERPSFFNREDVEFDAGTGTLLSYHGEGAMIVVPETIDGVAVKAVGDAAFAGSETVRVVVLPDCIETIGESAFENYHALDYVNVPTSLTTVGKYAFKGYMGEISIPPTVTYIDDGAFSASSCSGTLVLPEGLTYIGDGAFKYCSLLNEVYFPDTIEHIGAESFAAAGITYLVFANKEVIPEMDVTAFSGSTAECLADIDLPWDITREKFEEYLAAFAPMELPNVTIWRSNPADGGVCVPLNYSDGADYNNGLLTSYEGELPDVSVFPNADNIRVTGLGAGVFKDSQTLRSFYPHHCEWFTTIGEEAFAGSSVEYVEMYDSITEIGAGAFRNCVNLKDFSLPDFVETIGENAFEGCTGIEAVIMPDTLTSVSANVFQGCTGIKEVVMSDTLTSVGANAFEGCSGIQEVVMSGTLTSIGENAFEGCSGIEAVVMPDTLTSIGDNAFKGCSGIKEAVMPDALTYLGANAFEGCTGIEEIVLPETLTYIGAEVFKNCTNLKRVTVLCDPEILPEDYLSGCEDVTIAGLKIGKAISGSTGKISQETLLETYQVYASARMVRALCYEDIYELVGGVHGVPVEQFWEEGKKHVYMWYSDSTEDFIMITFDVLADGRIEVVTAFQYPYGTEQDGRTYPEAETTDLVGKSSPEADGIVSNENMKACFEWNERMREDYRTNFCYEDLRDILGADGKIDEDDFNDYHHSYEWTTEDGMWVVADLYVLSTGDEVFHSIQFSSGVREAYGNQ